MTPNLLPANALSRAVRDAFSDLNSDHAVVLASIPAARRLAMVCDLADFARQSYAIQARMAQPDASPAELRAAIRHRMGQHGRS